jgi:hypothetical protein
MVYKAPAGLFCLEQTYGIEYFCRTTGRYETMGWNYGDGTMGWNYGMELWDGTMGWNYGDGTMGWNYGNGTMEIELW